MIQVTFARMLHKVTGIKSLATMSRPNGCVLARPFGIWPLPIRPMGG
jgi:hypothetical protein